MRLTRRSALIGAAGLAACAPSVRDHLVLWHAYRGREADALAKAIALYNDTRPKGAVPAKAIAIPFDAFADKITAAVPRGKGPDVFIFAHERVGGWVEAGRTVEPLGFWMDDTFRAGFVSGLLDALTYRGEIFGLPLNFKSIALIYNRKMLPTPPSTSAEMLAAAKKQTDAQRGRFGLAYPFEDFFYHAALQNGCGGGVFAPDKTPILDAPGNVRAAEIVRAWRDAGVMPDEPSQSVIQALFNEGRVPMVLSGPWFLGEVSKDIEVGVAPLPRLSEADNQPMRPLMSVEAAFVSAGSPRTEEAFGFASFLAGPEAGLIMARDGGQLHAAAKVYDAPEVKADPVTQGFKAQAELAVATPNFPQMTLVWNPADKALKKFLKGEATPQAALAEAQAEVVASIAALKRSGA